MSNVIVFGQCSINCCQWGSLTPTGRDKETDGSRLCGLLWLWPDCAALFTVGGVRVFMCARLHKQTHLCHDREKRCGDRTYTTVTAPSPSPSPSPWWISSQSEQESHRTDGSACSYSTYQTMQESFFLLSVCGWMYGLFISSCYSDLLACSRELELLTQVSESPWDVNGL